MSRTMIVLSKWGPKLIDRLLREAKTTLRNTLIKETECEWKELQNQGYGALNKDGGSQWLFDTTAATVQFRYVNGSV